MVLRLACFLDLVDVVGFRSGLGFIGWLLFVAGCYACWYHGWFVVFGGCLLRFGSGGFIVVGELLRYLC